MAAKRLEPLSLEFDWDEEPASMLLEDECWDTTWIDDIEEPTAERWHEEITRVKPANSRRQTLRASPAPPPQSQGFGLLSHSDTHPYQSVAASEKRSSNGSRKRAAGHSGL